MKIKIDTRENEEVVAEFVLLQEKLEKQGILVELEKEMLICGDVIVGNVVFERKEKGDFIASIIDHRLKEQCAKMRLNFEHAYIVVVGDMFSTQSAINPMAVTGAQCSVLVRYGIPFIHVENNTQFAWVVYSVVSKLNDGKVFNPQEHEIFKYASTDEGRLVSMLAASGIGVKKAKILAAFCKNDMGVLMNNIDAAVECEGVGPKTVKQLKAALGIAEN